MNIALKRLSLPQQYALIDMVFRGGIEQVAAGYDGTCVHRVATIKALERRGLCRRKIGAGTADPTELGRRVVRAELRSGEDMVRALEALL